MAASEGMKLLFFDTFSHENSDDFNLDLVQFPGPVYITEVRVIPLGTRVQADFPGGVRLGATNPSQFHVDFFVNDLSKNGAATFQTLGSLEYKHNVEIQVSSSTKIPTDGLVLRGFYSTITLAIYGAVTKVVKEKQATPPPPATVTAVKTANSVDVTEPCVEMKNEDSKKVIKVEKKEEEMVVSVKEPAKPRIATPEPLQPLMASDGHYSNRSREDSSNVPSEVGAKKDDKVISKSRLKDDKDDTDKVRRDSWSHRERNRLEREGSRGRENDRTRDKTRDNFGSGCGEGGGGGDKMKSGSTRDKQDSNVTVIPSLISLVHQDTRSHPPLRRSRPPSPKVRRPCTPTSPHPSEVNPPIPSPAVTASVSATAAAVVLPEQETNKATEKDAAANDQGEIFEPLTPETSPTTQGELLSDSEVQDAGYNDYYEEILSDEEEMFESEDRIMDFQGELDYDVGEDSYVTSFNPYQCEFAPLLHFSDPSLTPFEAVAAKKLSTRNELTKEASQASYDQLVNLIQQVDRNLAPERWVEVIEIITTFLVPAAQILSIGNDRESILDVLVDWCCKALDFDLALSQPQAVFKVRQLKAGIKLATALFNSNREIVQKLLGKDIQIKLLRLYTKEYMALSLKLLILKAIDASVHSKEGMLAFVDNKSVGQGEEETNVKEDVMDVTDENKSSITGYQTLLNIFLAKQSTRATVAITALLNKVHFFEVIQQFAKKTESLFNILSTFTPTRARVSTEMVDDEFQQQCSGVETDDADLQNLVSISRDVSDSQKSDLKDIASCLLETLNFLSTAQTALVQPRRSLPVKTQFEIAKNPNSCYSQLYSLLNDCHFMESLLLLLLISSASPQPQLMPLVCGILNEFLASQHGMLFLLSHTEICNAIHRVLLQGSEEVRDDVSEDTNTLMQLGLQMVHYLQALQCVDALLSEVQNVDSLANKEIDDPEILSNLHVLYTMTFTSLGRAAVVNTLSSERNLEAILPFVQPTCNEEHDLKLRKSACIGYASELLLMTVRQSENINLLENFAEKLLSICSQELTSKVHELGIWLAPTRKLSGYNYDALPQLCVIVVASIEDVVSCSGELITTLRILHHLCVPSENQTLCVCRDDSQEELKYKYAILQLFANDMLSSFLTILQKLCDAHQYPTLHAPSLVGQRGLVLVAVIKPIVSIVRHMLSNLIQCRNAEFKDVTSVKILLRVYTLLSSFPASGAQSTTIQKIQTDIIDTLLTFTQPVLDGTESEEALNSSLWTQMVQEVFRYVLTSPKIFISGMSVISELLPLPFPIHSQEALSSEQITKAVNYRKLWSAHLHSVSQLIQDVVTTLGGTGDSVLQQLVRRVSIQLADLSAPTALVVVRGLLDAILDGIAVTDDLSRDNVHLSHLCRLLNLLAILLSNACVKAALLHLIRSTAKIDKKYGELLSKLGKNLNSSPPLLIPQNAEKTFNLQPTHECIASLCDDEITLISTEVQLPHVEQLANSLPSKEKMAVICGALWDHLASGSFSNASVIICLRTLVMLTEHDYGFYNIKICLDKRPIFFHSILSSVCSNFIKDNTDYLSGLSTFLELLRLLVSLEDEGPRRSLEISALELAKYLKWEPVQPKSSVPPPTSENDKVDVPTEEVVPSVLHQLVKLLDFGREEDSLESQTLENVQWLIQFLNDNSQAQPLPDKEWQEVVLPPPEKLLQQFSMRLNCLVGDVDEEALSSSYWMPQSGDDSDQESEQVACDLKAMAEEFCAGLNIVSELENLFLQKDDNTNDKDRKNLSAGKRKYQPLINPGSKEQQPRKKPFIAPMRGRGYARGMIHSSRANDPFRSRPPNTSRPPSMHVDDFVALEIFQPPTSTSSQSSKRVVKEGSRGGRGRGSFDASVRDFGTTRTHFFQQETSGNYGPRDERGRGGNRGSSRPLSANVWTRESAQSPLTITQTSKVSQKFGPVTPRSYLHPPHPESRSEPRSQTSSRSTDPSTERFARVVRGAVGSSSSSSKSGNLGFWPPRIRNKERDSRLPLTGSQNRGCRDTSGRHARTFTR